MSQLYADAIQLVEQGSYDELKRILPHLTQQQRAEVDPTLITQARERYSALDFSAAFSISGLILDNAEARSLHFSMQRVFAQLLSTSGDLGSPRSRLLVGNSVYMTDREIPVLFI